MRFLLCNKLVADCSKTKQVVDTVSRYKLKVCIFYELLLEFGHDFAA